MIYVSGVEEVVARLLGAKDHQLAAAIEVVGQVGDLIATNAKEGHAVGSMPHNHFPPRYQNRTTNLTNSIDSKLTNITAWSVEGQVFAGMEYAAEVESRGYNVISVQTDMALVELKEILSDLK